MTPPGPFYDAHLLLVQWLGSALGVRACTELPADLAGELPLVQVQVIGGAELNPAVETVSVDIDVYVGPTAEGLPDPGTGSDLAERIRTALLYVLPGYVTPDGHATVVGASTVSRPAPRPYDQTPIRRYQAAYRLLIQTRD